MAQVIVVGGGLAGLSAAHTLLERGANVLLLDKQGSVSLSLSFFLFPFLFFNLPPLPLASWVETQPKLHPASTVLALRLSKITASQTPQRFSLTIPRVQCVFSGINCSYSAEVHVLHDVGS
jgi:cation diffusion facilitator CzcD-associated flavoprotein CzcO